MMGVRIFLVTSLLFLLLTFSDASSDQDLPLPTANNVGSNLFVVRKAVGDKTQFHCNVSNINQAIWQRSVPQKISFAGLNPTGNDNGNAHISPGNNSLSLDTVTMEDSGNYTCIENGNRTNAKYWLIVNVERGDEGKSSHGVQAYENNLQVIRKSTGDQARFECNVSNITQSFWKRSTDLSSGLLFSGLNSKDLDTRNVHILVDSYSLRLHPVVQEDEGTYTCIEQGKIKAEYLLIVKALSPCSKDGRKSCKDCCTSDAIQKDLKRMEKTEVNEGNVKEVAEQLEQVSSHVEHVHPDGLESIVHILHDIVTTNASEHQVTDVTDSVLNIASNIMTAKDEVTDQVPDISIVPRLLEQQAISVHSRQKNYSQVLENVGFSAVQIGQSSLKREVTFGSFNDDSYANHEKPPLSKRSTGVLYEKPSVDIISSITLPSSIIERIYKDMTSERTVPLTFFVYRDAKVFPAKESYDQSNETRTFISSHVISATVAIENVEIKDLPDDSQVATTFYSFPVAENGKEVEERRTCVFWKYSETDGSGEWSGDGCRKVEDSLEKRRVKCLCNHLTSFAVLVHVRVVYQPPPHYFDVIFKIGCVLSIIGLSFCIVTLLSFKSARGKQQSQIHIHLCIALIALYLTFLIGIDRTKNPLRCKLTASLIQYFALSSMVWMSVEAFNLFVHFWMMRRDKINLLIPVSIVVAWGGPLVAAILVFFFDRSNDFDRHLSYCFLRPGYGLYFGFLILMGLLFLFNCVIFVLVTYRVTCRKILATNRKAKRKERMARLRGTFIFWVLLGMSWAFGFLSVITVPPFLIIFEVLFAFCLSLQGVCMFYMLVIKKPELKQEVIKMTMSARASVRESIRMKKWRYVPGDSFMAYFQNHQKDTTAVSAAVQTVPESACENDVRLVETPTIIP